MTSRSSVQVRDKNENEGSKVLSYSNDQKNIQNYENKPLLLDRGPLVKGKLIKRPSSKVKSPYVADVQILDDSKQGVIVQAHSPALDCGGLCDENAIVLMSERPPGGTTSHAIELVLAPGPSTSAVNDEGDDLCVLVGYHPSLGEKLAEQVLLQGLLKDSIGFGPAVLRNARTSDGSPSDKRKRQFLENDDESHDRIKDITSLYKQITYGDSRIDFELVQNNSVDKDRRALIEIKNVVCSDFSVKSAPKKKGPNHCVIIAEEGEEDKDNYRRSGLFPWGTRGNQKFEGQKVVSERAIKHLRNLSSIAKKSEVEPILLFVSNRSDCVQMRPCHEACPVFALELKKAAENGVKVLCFRVHWTMEGKAFFDGIVPVTFNI